ncbi:MAG: hypothetical protein M3O50_21275, partial [Myxococcota bacterium]|nr:hypothetical protein [Myxococcota bacterium]
PLAAPEPPPVDPAVDRADAAAGASEVPPRAARPAGRPDCNPPYSVDTETGKRRWKLECL